MRTIALLSIAGVLTAAGCRADESTLPDVAAFATGIETNVHSVRSVDPAEANAALAEARARGEAWAADPVLVAAHLFGTGAGGRFLSMAADLAPADRDLGDPIRSARIVLEDMGWFGDSVAGQRRVVWLSRDAAGDLRVDRALEAWLCSRPYRRFYSAEPCP